MNSHVFPLHVATAIAIAAASLLLVIVVMCAIYVSVFTESAEMKRVEIQESIERDWRAIHD